MIKAQSMCRLVEQTFW